MQHKHSSETSQSKQFAEHELVFMMGEELKKPLMAIKLLAESSAENSRTIQLEARKALRTVDNVLLYQQLAADQTSLDLAPVHVGSTLTQVAAELRPLSIEHGCETEVFIQSGISAVDSQPAVLRSAIESLWQAMLGMTQRPSPLTWHIRRSSQGIRIAVVNNSIDTAKVSLQKSATCSAGSSRQPFAGVTGPATDLLAAQGIFEKLGVRLKKAQIEGRQGFSVTLPVSAQLRLV